MPGISKQRCRVEGCFFIENLECRTLLSAPYTLSDSGDFASSVDPASSVVLDAAGDVFGTTVHGGSAGLGSVFEVSGSTGALSTAASFTGTSTGENPTAGLVLDSSGNLYGVTTTGGAHGTGTIYELPAGTHTLATLASFTTTAGPIGPLVIDSNGNLFGITSSGGSQNAGSVFELAVGGNTITTVASLSSTSTGGNPIAGLMIDPANNLYGSTTTGGTGGAGTVFEIAAGTGAITVLANFSRTGVDGSNPDSSLIMDQAGDLYGITASGGTSGDGNIFQVSGGSLINVASFTGINGSDPVGSLAIDPIGDIYGVTSGGGGSGDGTVFELPAGSSTITTLTSFDGSIGSVPVGGLTIDAYGDLYGTATTGGGHGFGSVFCDSPSTATQLAIAQQPVAVIAGTSQAIVVDLENSDGSVDIFNESQVTLTVNPTSTGGVQGDLTVYSINGVATFDGLIFSRGTCSLTASSDRASSATASTIIGGIGPAQQLVFIQQPVSAVVGQALGAVTVAVEDAGGNIVITDGSAITLSTIDSSALGGTLTESAVAGVAAFTDLTSSIAGPHELLASDGNLTTTLSNVFTPVVGPATQLAFCSQPSGGMAGAAINSITVAVEDSCGNVVTGDTSIVTLSSAAPLLGTTSTAAVNGLATFTNVSITAAGVYTLIAHDGSLLPAISGVFPLTSYAVTSIPFDGTIGNPQGSLVEDAAGNFYGTTPDTVYEVTAGGTINTLATAPGALGGNLAIDSSGNLYGTILNDDAGSNGSVFEIATGSGVITMLAAFNSTTGDAAFSGVIVDHHGNLFGTTADGGSTGDGTVFEIAAGSGSITTVASFDFANGSSPEGRLLIDSSGDLFGTTAGGGSGDNGTVFELPAGSGSISMLASFDGTSGFAPQAGLVIDSSGDLFGVTPSGGASGGGSIFEITAGSGVIATLASFPAGATPTDTLAIDSSGNLFGTTVAGGTNGDSTVFELLAGSGSITTLATLNPATLGQGGLGADANSFIPGVSIDASGNIVGTVVTGGMNGSGGVFEISAPPVTQAVIVQQPVSVAAGSLQSITIDLENASGLVDALDQSTVTLSVVSGPPGGVVGTLSVAALDGVATFSGLSFTTAGSYTLSVASGQAVLGTTSVITVHAGAAVKLVFTEQPTNTVAGESIGPIGCAIEDAFGNVVTTDVATVQLMAMSGPAVLTLGSAAEISGVATFTGLTINQAGTWVLSSGNGLLPAAVSSSFIVAPGAAAVLVITQQPSDAVAEQNIGTVIAEVQDTFGNIVISNTPSVNVTTTDGSVIGGTTAVMAVAGVATFTNLAMHLSGTRALIFSSGTLPLVTSANFTISPAAAAAMIFTHQPVNTVAGQLLGMITAAVVDAFGNVVVGDASSALIATVDGTVVLGTTHLFTANGVITFSDLTIDKAGIFQLSVTDGSLTAASSRAFTISPATGTQLAVVSQPVSGQAGQVMGAVTVDVEDAFGNLVSSADPVVTIAGPEALLEGKVAVTAGNGVAVFSDLSITSGGTYTLAATASGLSAVTAAPITIAALPQVLTAGKKSAVVAVGIQSLVPAVRSKSKVGTLSVVIQSANGATVLSQTAKVKNGHVSIGSLNFKLAGMYTETISDHFGHEVIRQIMVSPAAATQLEFVVQPMSVNQAMSISINLLDKYGNIATNRDGSLVTLKLGSYSRQTPGPTLGGAVTATVINGVATFPAITVHASGKVRLLATCAGVRGAVSNWFGS